MQTTDLIKIEKIDEAPFEHEINELDYSLMPALNKYIEMYGQNGIDRIRKFMSNTADRIQMSYDYKNNQ